MNEMFSNATQNDWIWIEDADTIAAAIALEERGSRVGLVCDSHYGVCLRFESPDRCEIEDGLGVDGEPVVYAVNHGDTPTRGTTYAACEVFELVRLIPEIKKSVPPGNIARLGGLRAILEAFVVRRNIKHYITGKHNAL
jgi:hypothetical protein